MKSLVQIKLKSVHDKLDGLLLIAESNKEIPFPIRRVYFIDDLNFHSLRGFHAHKKLKQVIMCLRGKFELEMYDGKTTVSKMIYPGLAVLIPPMVWHSMRKFYDECLIVVFASQYFSEKDYIRKFTDFKKRTK